MISKPIAGNDATKLLMQDISGSPLGDHPLAKRGSSWSHYGKQKK